MLEKKIIICDIDGTIANNDHRQHLLKKFKDWDKFFSQLHLDEPYFEIIEKIKEFKKNGKEIVFITGRPERYRDETNSWLEKYFKFNYELLMRPNNETRSKIIVKTNIFKQNFSPEEIKIVFENDNALIKLWRSFGLKTEQVKIPSKK